jgi:hypothetical protein
MNDKFKVFDYSLYQINWAEEKNKNKVRGFQIKMSHTFHFHFLYLI